MSGTQKLWWAIGVAAVFGWSAYAGVADVREIVYLPSLVGLLAIVGAGACWFEVHR